MESLLNNPIGELIRSTENDFLFGTVLKSQYVEESPYEDISRIEAYLNSKHISGEQDSQGRDKPFFNICLANRNIWFRATDIDRKNIVIQDRNPITALIAKIYLQEMMNKNNFGQFLNNWGLVLAGYNEAVVKSVEKGGNLDINVVPWSKLYFDSVDFENNPKIEILELTPSQLKMRDGYDAEMVDALLEAKTARETGRRRKDNKNEYIKLYEVHGKFPLSYLTGEEEDEKEFAQQMHVISFVSTKRGEYNDYCLYKGKEAQDPYMLTALLPEVDGSIGFNGSVKNLFNAQWMQNHTVKQIKDQLDLSSKLIFQTSDGNFVGQNALNSIETGDILIHKMNEPLTKIANDSHDITSLQNYSSQWKVLGNEINGISEAMLGQNPPSGTAWRQTQAILNESHSLFEVMTENKGLYLERLVRERIIPFIKKKLNNSDELVARLEAEDIKKIDKMYLGSEVNKQTNKKILDRILNGGTVPTPEEQVAMTQETDRQLQGSLNLQGNVRTLKPSEITEKTWKELFKDLEWHATVNITGEAINDNDMLSTLATVLQIIGNNPQALQNPAFALVFNRAIALTGVISPIEIEQVSREVQTTPQPTQGKVDVGALKTNEKA